MTPPPLALLAVEILRRATTTSSASVISSSTSSAFPLSTTSDTGAPTPVYEPGSFHRKVRVWFALLSSLGSLKYKGES